MAVRVQGVSGAFLPGLKPLCLWVLPGGGAAISKSDELRSGFGFVFAEAGSFFRRFAFGRLPLAGRLNLSLDVMDFVGSSVLRAFGECLGAQRR